MQGPGLRVAVHRHFHGMHSREVLALLAMSREFEVDQIDFRLITQMRMKLCEPIGLFAVYNYTAHRFESLL